MTLDTPGRLPNNRAELENWGRISTAIALVLK
jgi:hypothetical protein